jgi:hypothetical protein
MFMYGEYVSAVELESNCAGSVFRKRINVTCGYLLEPNFQQIVWLNAAMNI